MTGPRKLYIKSYGCQMNVYDSLRMADMLAPDGFAETSDVADADLVVLNTCHIREKAAEKVYSEIGRLRLLKDDAAKAELLAANPGHKKEFQRLKGLGEMDWQELKATTMDAASRTLLQVSVEQAAAADTAISTLMGDDVEARKKFIQKNAKDVRFIDI